MTTTIRVAHSPDSDDAFMFYALAEGKIDTDITYVHELSDIESLNQRARHKELDVSAVSIHAYAYIAHDYALLNSGSSLVRRYSADRRAIRRWPGRSKGGGLAGTLFRVAARRHFRPRDGFPDRRARDGARCALPSCRAGAAGRRAATTRGQR